MPRVRHPSCRYLARASVLSLLVQLAHATAGYAQAQKHELPQLPAELRKVTNLELAAPRMRAMVFRRELVVGAAPVNPARGGVVVSLSVRMGSRVPRFVLASRRTDDGTPGETNETDSYQVPPQITDYFNAQAARQIETLDRACTLSEGQKAKLSLAAKGDLNRIAREARLWHEKFGGKSALNAEGGREAAEMLDNLNVALAEGISRDKSFFGMVLQNSLSKAQAEIYALEQFRAQIALWKLKPMSSEQADKLVGLMLEKHQANAHAPLICAPDYCASLVNSLRIEQLDKELDKQILESIGRLR